ncbi:glycosyltransferase family 4 protein [Phenylobacterium immobile]|uniref:glycosyltransferase family 4 protein n=1 Tax=Phenylobacterium immobile TaxID=21 RepID=UPI000A4508CC|nr:glycosyltransferase family 1 protein [Phenylobacterium immobile]
MIVERPYAIAPAGRPLRVALFSGNYNYTLDGANKTLNRLVGHLLNEAGFQVRVYSPSSARPAFPPVGDLVSVPSAPIPLRPDYRVALGLPFWVRRDVEAFRPDVIHVSSPDPLGEAAIRLARRRDLPVVASVHTHFDDYLRYYALDWLRPYLKSRVQAFYSSCDYVLAPTRSIADDIVAANAPGQVRVWPRGVDRDLFNPERRSAAWRGAQGLDGRPVIAFLGRLVMEKGLGVFADAVRRLERALGPTSVLVIGDGPAAPWFKANLPQAVFTGRLGGEHLATAIASADLLFNPSTTETFGNVNLEAMASGLPVVCADVPNSRTLVQHGRSGLLCAPSHPQAYADALAALLGDAERRAEMGAEALRQSAAYRWPQILNQTVDIYCEAVGSPRLSSASRDRRATPFWQSARSALANPAILRAD